MENDLKLAFPVAYSSGFSKLEYISAMCLQGMLSNSTSSIAIRISEDVADTYTKDAVLLAKSLLTELEKEKKIMEDYIVPVLMSAMFIAFFGYLIVGRHNDKNGDL